MLTCEPRQLSEGLVAQKETYYRLCGTVNVCPRPLPAHEVMHGILSTIAPCGLTQTNRAICCATLQYHNLHCRQCDIARRCLVLMEIQNCFIWDCRKRCSYYDALKIRSSIFVCVSTLLGMFIMGNSSSFYIIHTHPLWS